MTGSGRRRGGIVLVLGASLACAHAPPPDPVVLALGNEIVRWSDFERHVRALEERGGAPVAPDVQSALLEPYLEGRILVLEARNRGLLRRGSSPAEEETAVGKLLGQTVLKTLDVADDEVARYYSERQAEFRIQESVTLRQILVPTSNEARDVRRRLGKDPKSFEVLARKLSRAPEAAQGGLMGTYARSQLPQALEDVAFALQPGATSEIVETPLGYHVLRVESYQPARDATLEECRVQIHGLLTRQRADETQRQFVRALMARAKVNHEAAYLSAGPR